MSQPSTPRLATPSSSSQASQKSKNRTTQSKKAAKRRMRERVGYALDTLRPVMVLAADTAGNTGIPGLQLGLLALSDLLGKIQTMNANIEGVSVLVKRVATLSGQIAELYSRDQARQLPTDMRQRIEAATKKWSEIAARAQNIKSRGTVRRFFSGDADARTLGSLVQEISNSIQEDFLLQGILNVEENVHRIREEVTEVHHGVAVVQEDVGVIRENVDGVLQDVTVVRQGIGDLHEDVHVVRRTIDDMGRDIKSVKTELDGSFMPTYARNAPFDASDVRRQCLKGTRVDVLETISAWITAVVSRKKPGGHESIFWISGLAGTGKTTIACSVAQRCRELGLLGASFFCSRFDAECRDPKSIFRTISRQLCHFHEPFKVQITIILKEDPTILTAGVTRQFEQLILRPLEALKSKFPPAVIVLDALDECFDESATSIILSVIAKYISRIAGCLLFVITSRPERQIAAYFKNTPGNTLADSATTLLLHSIELTSVLGDIRLYLDDGFAEVRKIFGLSEWPPPEAVDRLVELSGGLFVWAATALRFIMDMSFSDPYGQLESLTESQPESQLSTTILHSLYSQIAEAAFSRISTSLTKRLHPILGVLAIAQEPLSAAAIAGLVDADERSIRTALIGLHSVLHVPEDSATPVRVIHPTFAEYLLDSSLSKPDAFCIDATPQHFTLFRRCLEVMAILGRNVAGISSPASFQSEIPDLQHTVKRRIPPHVAYACIHWSTHFDVSAGNGAAQDSYALLHEFLVRRMIYWIEASSLLQVLDGATSALEVVRLRCQNLGGSFSGLVPLLADCHRFVRTFFVCIDTAPLQLYHSALPCAPTNSLTRKTYAHELVRSGTVIVCRGAPTHWAPCIDSFSGHGGTAWVCAVEFSPDGSHFVTGGWDKSVKLWKTASRNLTLVMRGHKGDVNCVAFSPDGVHIASGSNRRTVCVWHATSGELVRSFEGHAAWVYSVAYSKDGNRLLSSSDNGEVKLWDISNGDCLCTLRTNRETCQVAISPDGGVIAHGYANDLCLYDISSTMSRTIGLSGPVEATLFSPDGRYVAARTTHTISIWTASDLSLVRPIESSERLTGRLAFSHDAVHIGCGSDEGSVYLWKVASPDEPRTFHGHIRRVRDLAWSPDNSQVISVANDGIVRVWDVTQSSASSRILDSATDVPHSPTSTDPYHFAVVHTLDTAAILHLPHLDVRHVTTAPSTVEGVPTVKHFAHMAGAWDAALHVTKDLSRWKRARAWALITGRQYMAFSLRTASISSDGSLLAYCSPSSNKIVDIYDFLTGKIVASLVGHTSRVHSIIFSHDGTMIATSAYDDTVKVWAAATGALLHNHTGHQDSVLASAFSSDGKLIASASRDKTVDIFELQTDRTIRVLGPHRAMPIDVIFADTDDLVLSLDEDRRLYVWDVATGARLLRISLDDGAYIHSLDFSPDGTGILVSGKDEESRVCRLWQHEGRSWPIYTVSSEGWVYAKSPGRTVRLCWLLPEWRAIFSTGGGRFCCPDRDQKRGVEFDVSDLPEYVQTWGPNTT